MDESLVQTPMRLEKKKNKETLSVIVSDHATFFNIEAKINRVAGG